MQALANIPDAQRGRAYFENKVAFTLGPIELSHQLKSGNIVIVDVRAAEDYEKSHIPGAINLPHGSWDNTRGLAKDKTNLVYCYNQQCHLAANACVGFAAKGYPVMELEGGFEAWEQHGQEVEQGAPGSQMRKAA